MALVSAPGRLAASRNAAKSASVSASRRTIELRTAAATGQAARRPSSVSGSQGIWKKNMYQLRASWCGFSRRCCWKIARWGQFIHETPERFGVLHGEGPRDGPAPVVPDDHGLAL